jgi:hypothetical protein
MPDTNSGILSNGENRGRLAQANAPMILAFAVVVQTVVENHPRVRRVWWQYRVNIAFSSSIGCNSPEALLLNQPSAAKDFFWVR